MPSAIGGTGEEKVAEVTLTPVDGGLTAAKGFRANGVSCGLKERDIASKDIALLLSEVPCETACLFTKNEIKGAHVPFDISRADNRIQAVIANSGCANCLTGPRGEADCTEMVSLAENFLSLPAGSVMTASTGVIGNRLIMDRVRYGIEKVCNLIRNDSNPAHFADAIQTTDMKRKHFAAEFSLGGKRVTIGATAKGSGGIKPDLGLPHGTLLVFLTTDAAVSKPMLEAALAEAAELSFNRISVDNDTGTNDTVFLLSNGLAENPVVETKNEDWETFRVALTHVCQEIGKLVVKDGEGATKLTHIQVKGALTDGDARRAARALADSFRVKTALYGQYPAWGRILAALGYSGAKFEFRKLRVSFNDLCLFENGEVNRLNEGGAGSELIPNDLKLTMELGVGKKEYFLWTSDLSVNYVKINSNFLS
jgi:glutamate N-acetyltransferase/amino-acid N-acetyltransferase